MDHPGRFLDEPTPFTIYVTNLPFDCGNDLLMDIIPRNVFPTFVRAYGHRGTGLLSFRTRGDAERAMAWIRKGKSRANVEWAEKGLVARCLGDPYDRYREMDRPPPDYDRDRRDYEYGRTWDRFREREEMYRYEPGRMREREREREMDDRRAQPQRRRDAPKKIERTHDWNKLAIARYSDEYLAVRGGVKHLFQKLMTSAIQEYPTLRSSPPPVGSKIELPVKKKKGFTIVHENLTVP